MRISTWNSESKIRCLYKIDYSNIKSISANKPSSSEGEYRFFFTINFHRTVNYYVNDHYIGDANKTFFICNCYGDLTYSSAMDRYTENFVNQIYRKLNMFCGYEHYKLVNFTGTTQISSPVKPNNKTTNYVQKSTVVEEPNEKPISPVENQAGFTYDYDEDDGYDYGDDE